MSELACSFCGKKRTEVYALSVNGPEDKATAAMCNFCVNACVSHMASIPKALDVLVLSRALLALRPPDAEAVPTPPDMPKPPVGDGIVIDAEMVVPP